MRKMLHLKGKSMSNDHLNRAPDLYVLNGSDDKYWETLLFKRDKTKSSIFWFMPELKKQKLDLPNAPDHWEMFEVSVDPEWFQEKAGADYISDATIERFHDAMSWTPFRLVSNRLREILDREFPGGSTYFPFWRHDPELGKVHEDRFWYWLPKYRIDFEPGERQQNLPPMKPHIWGAFGGMNITREFRNNPAVKAFLKDFPFYGKTSQFSQVAFQADVYQRIKAANLTGFNEANYDNWLKQKPQDTVGYIWYGEPA